MHARWTWLLVGAALALSTGELRAQPTPPPSLGSPAGPTLAPPSPATAGDAVALLPLDADAKLEIYGQPVASEIARALVAGGIEVVVVGPKMAVPERARLIVDGKIAGPPRASKSETVTLTIRVRNAADGIVLETLEATAPGLANIDRAAADLSARVLPVVRGRLSTTVKREAPPATRPTQVELQADLTPPNTPHRLAPLLDRKPIGTKWHTVTTGDPKLATALDVAVPGWSQGLPGNKIDLAVRSFRLEGGAVPLARARVRVKVALGDKVLFDRTVVTDTVVGDRAMRVDAMAKRVAHEVLAIVKPHLQRRAIR